MQSNCKHIWFGVGKFWNFTLFLTNSAHSIEWFFRGEFNLQSSHSGQWQCWHLGPLAVPSTGCTHSKQIVGVFGLGPTTNGSSSRTIVPATTDFAATAYRPISLFCSIRSKFVEFDILFIQRFTYWLNLFKLIFPFCKINLLHWLFISFSMWFSITSD